MSDDGRTSRGRVNPDTSTPGFDPNTDNSATRMDRSKLLRIAVVVGIVVVAVIVVVLVIGAVTSSNNPTRKTGTLPAGTISVGHVTKTEATTLEAKLAPLPGVQNSAYYPNKQTLQVFFVKDATAAERAKAQSVVDANS